ncbi:MAG: TonB-dependent receptor [Bryobacterales bacterium]|nr:TonB-dependent receptor [Bryobacterales bacterium]
MTTSTLSLWARLLVAAAVLCCAALPVLAQFETASVLGQVDDPAGLPIQGARVTLSSIATGVSQNTQTDGNGTYQFFNVKPGPYRVSAEAQGFKTGVAQDFTVTVNARQRVNLTLEVGAVTESVTVSDAAAVLEADSSSRGQVVGQRQIVGLPLNGRAYADLALLIPGVRRSGIAASRDASFNVNGMRSSQNNFIVDGVDNNAYGTSNQGFSNQVVQISPDAVQEFRLETNNFSAEYGRAGGAIINATIRSGTNEFHGAAWEFLRNTKLNATGFFKPVNNEKPVLIQNQFGAALGGPIVKDRMFFFGNYEGFRRVSRAIRFATLPRVENRTGNIGIPIRNPYDGSLYANGVIPASQVNRFALDVLGGLPTPTGAGTANNFQSQPSRTDNSDKGDGRFDYYVNDKMTLFARYSHRELNTFEPPAIPGPSGGDSNGNVRVMNRQVAFGSTYNVDPTSLFEFRMGISHTDGGKFPIFVGTEGVAERYGFPNVPSDPRFTGGIYGQAINGFTALGVQSSNPQFQNPSVLNPKVNYSKIAGRHTLKAGYEYQAVNTDIDDFNPKYGRDQYAGRFSQAPGTPNNDLQFLADFLVGARSRYERSTATIVGYRQRMHFLHLQDDFRVNQKLTLNAGLRYEYGSPQWERENRISNFDQSNRTLIQASSGSTFNRALVQPDKNNFAPRIGLAYQVMPKTVIRSAYGISYIHFNRMGGENLLAFNLPFILNPFSNQVAPAMPNGGMPLCTSLNQRPDTCFRPTEQGYPNDFLSLANVNQTIVRTNHIPFDFRTSYVQNWHFTIQREITRNLVLDVAYVGNRGVGLMILGDLNQADPNQPGQNIALQFRRPIQDFGYIQSAFGGGFLNYHGLQAKVERRFDAGFYLLNSFTWSKAIDNASGHLESQNGDNSRVNYRDIRNERGVSGYNQPFNNTTTVIFDLPYGRGRKFGADIPRIADAFIGGWRLTAINSMTSGLPVNLTYSPASQFQVSGAPSYRPNLLGDPVTPEGQRSHLNYLNRDTVALPTDPSRPFGNAGRNIVRGPNFFQLDLGIHKDFLVTESHRLEFRTEMFNTLNRTNFTSPNGNRSSGAFGTINSTFPAREIQFALKYVF